MRRRLFIERIKKLLAKHDKAIQRAFEEAIKQRRESINLRALADAIEARDLGRAVEIAGISRADMFPFDQAVREAYLDGGRTVTEAAPAFTARVALDGNAPRAVEWAQVHVGGLITEIVDDQREAIRQIIAAQVEAGINPRKAAIGLRSQIGLTTQQAGYAANARRQLELLDGAYFTRELRDRRFDALVRRAIADGKPLSQVDIDRIVGRYSDRLLKHRSEVITRTESITALRAGRDEGLRQSIEAGAINPETLTRVWDATMDKRTRMEHAIADGQKVKGIDEPFVLADGSRLMYPGDSSLGASGGQTINCRCIQQYVVDWLNG